MQSGVEHHAAAAEQGIVELEESRERVRTVEPLLVHQLLAVERPALGEDVVVRDAAQPRRGAIRVGELQVMPRVTLVHGEHRQRREVVHAELRRLLVATAPDVDRRHVEEARRVGIERRGPVVGRERAQTTLEDRRIEHLESIVDGQRREMTIGDEATRAIELGHVRLPQPIRLGRAGTALGDELTPRAPRIEPLRLVLEQTQRLRDMRAPELLESRAVERHHVLALELHVHPAFADRERAGGPREQRALEPLVEAQEPRARALARVLEAFGLTRERAQQCAHDLVHEHRAIGGHLERGLDRDHGHELQVRLHRFEVVGDRHQARDRGFLALIERRE